MISCDFNNKIQFMMKNCLYLLLDLLSVFINDDGYSFGIIRLISGWLIRNSTFAISLIYSDK